jgi:hypothetical protein
VHWYLSVPLKSNGSADVHGRLERVDSVSRATPLELGDARFLADHAGLHWPECTWSVENPKRFKGKYAVKGKPVVVRRKSR